MTETTPPKRHRLEKSSYLPIPQFLEYGWSHVINVRNESDEQCFKWSILAALHPVEGNLAEKVSSYERFQDELKFSDLEFPIKLQDIPRFEQQNDISVNVFSYIKAKTAFGRQFYETSPVHLSQLNNKRPIDLLYVYEEKKFHYCWIKDLSKWLNKKDVCCRYCLNTFQENDIEEHTRLCKPHGPQRVNIPYPEKNILNHKEKDTKVQCIIYADFECFLEPVEVENKEMLENEKTVINIHKPSGFAYKVVSTKAELNTDIQVYSGQDAAKKFIDELLELENSIKKKLNLKKIDLIPVVFHNLSRYDSHIIIQEFQKLKDEDIECLPLNVQEFISFSVGSLRFIDSYRFLNKSLPSLVASLVDSSKDLKETFRNTYLLAGESQEKFHVLLRKQVYPYEYIKSYEMLSESQLPQEEHFRDTLKDKSISKEDYEHAKKVWAIFNMQTLEDYHNLYVQTDVALLADVFEHFRQMSMELYKLDPAEFYSTSGLAWQAALKKTNVQLELLTDLDMHLMIESGKRGGVAMVSHRSSKAHNPSMPHYDLAQPGNNKWIIYLDANNLYGWAMSQPLPLNDFKWLTEEDISTLDIKNISDYTETGYILEVDLEYPEELHDQHNDFPLAPEKINLTEEMLSSYCRDLYEKFHFSETMGDKLIPNLKNKEKYVVHYRTLKLYLKLGMKVTKVHRVISFHQEPWLKPYIDFNKAQRQIAQDDVRKDFFKFMNNTVFGKTIENVRKYDKVIEFVFDDDDLAKAKVRPNFQECVAVNGTNIIQFQKHSLYLNKPVSVGFSILDLSKMFIYEVHYCKIKQKYGDKAKLLFTDTDSLCYELETEDVYDDLQEDRELNDLIDFSNYPQDHKLYNERNKSALGKMKNETRDVPIQTFIGLKPKMYSLVYGEREKNTAVGVQRDYTERNIKSSDYTKCLENKEQQQGTIHKIESLNHQLRTVKETKVTLTCYDDKRYISDEGIQSLAYGHYRIPKC
ncbi:hypothetical protein BgiMline_008451 [Biomphalaria glabrata]|nr:hypothetical protein BgiBS90_033986 [Biomphalaria glabrata]KAI8747574.1 hypothetical protein BgiMline_019292 [Biomphalaria glabrata]